MDEPRVDKKGEAIYIKAGTKREFFLLHGYTGSPTDFNELGNYLNKRFNANIRIVRLKGHGEKIENIDNLSYNDFYLQAENELRKDIENGMEIVAGGISIGSFIALQLSAKYPLRGIINISIPYKNRLLTGMISFLEPIIPKKHWKKPISPEEKVLRKNAFYYDINIRGFRIIKQAKNELNKVLDNIKAPCLIVHVDHDIFHKNSPEIIKEKISSKTTEICIFNTEKKASHNPFYTSQHEKLYEIIGDFVEKNRLFSQ